MSVTVRKYQGGEEWEVDLLVLLPDETRHRERRKVPAPSKAAAKRWGEARQRELMLKGPPERKKEVETLREFAPRFIDGYARANRHKPSGIAGKQTVLRKHLLPTLGDKRLNAITNEDVQALKLRLKERSPKTVNNVLTVLSVLLKKAVEWEVIDSLPCAVRLLTIPKSTIARFYGFEEFGRVVEAAKEDGHASYLVALLGGEAGLRCGEMMALEWSDVDLGKRQLSVARSEWKGHVTSTKGGRVRYVPMTLRLTDALKQARNLKGRRVVCDRKGTPLSQKEVQVIMRRVGRRANVKPGVHILRHTFCSHLAMRGAPAKAIQELAGHQDLTTTQQYMHLSPAALDAAIRLLDAGRQTSGVGNNLEAAGTGSGTA
jgi:integrase